MKWYGVLRESWKMYWEKNVKLETLFTFPFVYHALLKQYLKLHFYFYYRLVNNSTFCLLSGNAFFSFALAGEHALAWFLSWRADPRKG